MPHAALSVPPGEADRGEVPRERSPKPAPERVPAGGVPGRRTVTIQGRGAERYTPSPQRRRPARRPHERAGFRPDRAAMWAVLLGVLLVLVAATSSHAAATNAHAAATRSHAAVTRAHAVIRSSHAGTARFHAGRASRSRSR